MAKFDVNPSKDVLTQQMRENMSRILEGRQMENDMPDKMMAKDIPGSDFATKSLNIFREVIKRKLPRDAGDLPSRINVWGQPIPQTPEGVDPFIYNFIDPTKTRKATYAGLS